MRERAVLGAVALALTMVVAAGQPSSAADRVLVGAGDIAGCGWSADSATARLVERIPGTVFTAGDNVYPGGTLARFRRCYEPTWGRFRERTRPALGNHDYVSPRASGYFDYFGRAAGRRGRGYYRYELGTWSVIVLNSECGAVGGCYPGSPQARWLRRILIEHPTSCTLAIWHHPRFSSGPHGDAPRVGHFWRLLHAAGADVIINGHDHHYERFAPQDRAGTLDREWGIRQFVVGTGGAPLYAFRAIKPNSRARAMRHGVLKLTLHAESFDWRFIPVAGRAAADSGTAGCHGSRLVPSAPATSSPSVWASLQRQ